MARLNNPAGRLHMLLSAYQDGCAPGRSFVVVWSTVFDVRTDDVQRRLCDAVSLIPAIEAALSSVEQSDEQMELFYLHREAYVAGLIWPGGTWGSNCADVPIARADLVALGGISSFLSATAPEGEPPDEDEIAKLLQETAELITEVKEASGLSEPLRKALIRHLLALCAAIDDWRVYGAGGVTAASERIIGTLVVHGTSVNEANITTLKRVYEGAAKAWNAYVAVGTTALPAAIGWAALGHDLGIGR
jgi:hypothetical protein